MALKENLILSIKKAMQGEMDSVTLYQNAANHSDDPEIKQFFHSRRTCTDSPSTSPGRFHRSPTVRTC